MSLGNLKLGSFLCFIAEANIIELCNSAFLAILDFRLPGRLCVLTQLG